MYASLEPMLSSDFLMLSACELEMTDRSCNCLRVTSWFCFRKSICLLSASIWFWRAVFWLASWAVRSLQFFRSLASFALAAVRESIFAWAALNFLELTQEVNSIAERTPKKRVFLRFIVISFI